MRIRNYLALSAAAAAILAAAPVLAGTTSCQAQKTNVSGMTVQSSTPAGVSGSQVTHSMTGVGSNNAMGMTGPTAASQNQVSFGGASVGGMGSNGGNGQLNMNNGGMAGAMDDPGPSKINPKGGNAPQTDDHDNPMHPDGNYNYGGTWTYAATNGWGGHPDNGQDSHGNTWKNGQLWNGTDGDKTMKNGVPQDGTNDGNGKHLGTFDGGNGGDNNGGNGNGDNDGKGGGNTSEAGADTGNNSGNDGTNAAGQAVNLGTRGGNDGGGNGGGASGGTNAAGLAFNGGGRAGSDAPLGQPKTVEAFNGAKLNNGVTDPCGGSSSLH